MINRLSKVQEPQEPKTVLLWTNTVSKIANAHVRFILPRCRKGKFIVVIFIVTVIFVTPALLILIGLFWSSLLFLVTLDLFASSGKRNVTVWRPSVCLSVCSVFFLTLIERAAHATERDSPGAACDAASIHFGQTIKNSDIRVSQGFARIQFQSLRLRLLLVECPLILYYDATASTTILTHRLIFVNLILYDSISKVFKTYFLLRWNCSVGHRPTYAKWATQIPWADMLNRRKTSIPDLLLGTIATNVWCVMTSLFPVWQNWLPRATIKVVVHNDGSLCRSKCKTFG